MRLGVARRYSEITTLPIGHRPRFRGETHIGLKAHAAAIAAALGVVVDADGEYRLAIEKEREASAVLLSEKRRLIVGYRKAYNMLRSHFEDDPARAEEYFPEMYRKLKGRRPPRSWRRTRRTRRKAARERSAFPRPRPVTARRRRNR